MSTTRITITIQGADPSIDSQRIASQVADVIRSITGADVNVDIKDRGGDMDSTSLYKELGL